MSRNHELIGGRFDPDGNCFVPAEPHPVYQIPPVGHIKELRAGPVWNAITGTTETTRYLSDRTGKKITVPVLSPAAMRGVGTVEVMTGPLTFPAQPYRVGEMIDPWASARSFWYNLSRPPREFIQGLESWFRPGNPCLRQAIKYIESKPGDNAFNHPEILAAATMLHGFFSPDVWRRRPPFGMELLIEQMGGRFKEGARMTWTEYMGRYFPFLAPGAALSGYLSFCRLLEQASGGREISIPSALTIAAPVILNTAVVALKALERKHPANAIMTLGRMEEKSRELTAAALMPGTARMTALREKGLLDPDVYLNQLEEAIRPLKTIVSRHPEWGHLGLLVMAELIQPGTGEGILIQRGESLGNQPDLREILQRLCGLCQPEGRTVNPQRITQTTQKILKVQTIAELKGKNTRMDQIASHRKLFPDDIFLAVLAFPGMLGNDEFQRAIRGEEKNIDRYAEVQRSFIDCCYHLVNKPLTELPREIAKTEDGPKNHAADLNQAVATLFILEATSKNHNFAAFADMFSTHILLSSRRFSETGSFPQMEDLARTARLRVITSWKESGYRGINAVGTNNLAYEYWRQLISTAFPVASRYYEENGGRAGLSLREITLRAVFRWFEMGMPDFDPEFRKYVRDILPFLQPGLEEKETGETKKDTDNRKPGKLEASFEDVREMTAFTSVVAQRTSSRIISLMEQYNRCPDDEKPKVITVIEEELARLGNQLGDYLCKIGPELKAVLIRTQIPPLLNLYGYATRMTNLSLENAGLKVLEQLQDDSGKIILDARGTDGGTEVETVVRKGMMRLLHLAIITPGRETIKDGKIDRVVRRLCDGNYLTATPEPLTIVYGDGKEVHLICPLAERGRFENHLWAELLKT